MKHFLFCGIGLVALAGCDFLGDSKAQIEKQYLANNQELEQVIEDIRAQGLTAMSQSAEAGTLASCVVKQLNGDPMGAMIEVEGALQDSANLADLMDTITGLADKELSMESLPDLLQAGADTMSYLKTLLANYELAELQQQVQTLLEQGQSKSEDIGTHLRNLVEQCQ
ncbi:hypothetical protein [Pseudoalteromonas sp. OOF1S-7]|uniref:hypothetical protein n=1 Tax=Pseudoalteromonas sp. OOF1S-7 TaxID=2917757 RepID=UPI001EF4E2A6|nr:hypothetical protein [Pseudoalteromonas sp. OOF1S-7]MCG7536421.1 hypothetical protein [Pseudoalteromonas sp. OOF1S-7]